MTECINSDYLLNTYIKDLGNDIIKYQNEKIAYDNYIKKIKNIYTEMNTIIQEFSDCIKNNTKPQPTTPPATIKNNFWNILGIFIALGLLYALFNAYSKSLHYNNKNKKQNKKNDPVEIELKNMSQVVPEAGDNFLKF
jgi:hypothetical protein